MQYERNDGGRATAGRRGTTSDCVARAVSIASGRPYQEVYDRLAEGNATQRRSKHNRNAGQRTASKGIYVKRKWFKDYMAELGFEWTATMQIGSGCKVHLRADELPKGRLVCLVSRHAVAVIDGVINDTYDPSREGTRCVYGYWRLTGSPQRKVDTDAAARFAGIDLEVESEEVARMK